MEAIRDLLAAAGAHARSLGFDQWPTRFSARFVEAGIARGEVFVLEAGGAAGDGRAIGVCWLLFEDKEFWGPDDGEALYLHRLAVAAEVRGQGQSPRIIDWALAEVRRRGRRWLRLDCLQANLRLRAFYENQGFVHVGDREVGHGASQSHLPGLTVSLFQRDVGAG